MRKSSAIVTAILLVALGGMLVAADMALGPLAHDAEVSKELTALYESRLAIAAESHVRVFRLPASAERLAEAGRGLVVQAAPAERMLGRKGGERKFARRLATESFAAYEGRRIDWVEVDLLVGAERARSLFLRGDEGLQNAPVRACRVAKAD